MAWNPLPHICFSPRCSCLRPCFPSFMSRLTWVSVQSMLPSKFLPESLHSLLPIGISNCRLAPCSSPPIYPLSSGCKSLVTNVSLRRVSTASPTSRTFLSLAVIPIVSNSDWPATSRRVTPDQLTRFFLITWLLFFPK